MAGVLLPSAAFVSIFAAACATEGLRASEPPTVAGAETIIAIGDLHGGYDAYEILMREAGLIDRRGRWSGGEAIFVQTGDVPDRGPESRKIIEHLVKLEKQASRAGGEVVALVGNHEAMNVIGDLRYVDPGEYAAFKTKSSKAVRDNYFKTNKASLTEFYLAKDPALDEGGVRAAFDSDVPPGYLEHRVAWSPQGEIGGRVSNHDAIRIIGDTLFVHGGISNAYAAYSAQDINDRVRAALRGEGEQTILEDQAGPLWYRGNTEETEEGAIEIAAVLAAFGVKRIVVGHTPALDGIRPVHGGRVIMIDTGISDFYGGVPSYLRIDANGVAGVSAGTETDLTGETE